MSGPVPPQDGAAGAQRASQWRSARTELTIAAAIVIVAAVAGYALAGPEAVTIVAIGAAVFALVTARWLLPAAQAAPDIEGGSDDITSSSSTYRYWRYLSDLRDGVEVRAAYERRLRPALEHLLAARLAERHSVNLYSDPAAARRLLCRGARDADLWEWIDPAQAELSGPERHPTELPMPERNPTATEPSHQRGSQLPGIPRRTLERLINRLEQL
ncbi:MAG TPA: hypothetical protein VGI74_20525 [Streptosporangiaceae bacterium]|jgi:hypothetical protein